MKNDLFKANADSLHFLIILIDVFKSTHTHKHTHTRVLKQNQNFQLECNIHTHSKHFYLNQQHKRKPSNNRMFILNDYNFFRNTYHPQCN